MGDKTKIEWTDATWNPIRGCSRVTEGCRNCYAEKVAHRFCGPGQPYEGLIAKGGQWNGKITVVDKGLTQPLRWRKPRKIFVNSMSDLFHENVPDEVIWKVLAVMTLANHHVFQVLTKRPARMKDFMTKAVEQPDLLNDYCAEFTDYEDISHATAEWPPQNIWFGVSVEDQGTANQRINLLMDTPAAVRWISAEPLLGPVSLTFYDESDGMIVENMVDLDWVVVGGESGKDARPMHPEWVRSLRDQCHRFGVPFLFKQWGEWFPSFWPEKHPFSYKPTHRFKDGVVMTKTGKKYAGRQLDSEEHNGYPQP